MRISRQDLHQYMKKFGVRGRLLPVQVLMYMLEQVFPLELAEEAFILMLTEI